MLSKGQSKKRPRMEQQQRDKPEIFAGLHDKTNRYCRVPTVSTSDFSTAADASNEILRTYETFQVVHLPQYHPDKFWTSPPQNESKTKPITWNDICQIHQNLCEKDRASWCIETLGKTQTSISSKSKAPNPQEFLKGRTVSLDSSETLSMHAYCSFVVQHNEENLDNLVSRLPVSVLEGIDWFHEPCIWVFFGRNHPAASRELGESGSRGDFSRSDLPGRPEHTDAISHDGTWHFQLSGTKRWLLRPTSKLLENPSFRSSFSDEQLAAWDDDEAPQNDPNGLPSLRHFVVDCNKGDILIVNTRLWFHQTILPTQRDPSVSYARDFWTKRKAKGDPNITQDDGSNSSTNGVMMTNVDGLYATSDIPAGTIIFREDDMPDCELHRSKEPNCEVVELAAENEDDELKDGSSNDEVEEGSVNAVTHAVVSLRNIAAGEFFCIAESDSEEDDEEDDWDEIDEVNEHG